MAFDAPPYDDGQQLPPSNVEAEAAILGSILLDRSLIGKLAEIITPDDFYLNKYGVIYGAMLALYERHEPVDYLLLVDELDRSKTLAQAGGATGVAELLGAVPTPIHAEHYARIVVHAAIMRRLISAGGKVATIGFANRHASAVDAIEESLALVREVLPNQHGTGPRELADALNDYMEFAKSVSEHDESVSIAVPTGLQDLDRVLGGGMQRSDLIIVGARPGIGKTALALNIMSSVATVSGGTGLMFSLEMPIDQIVGRLLAISSGIEATRIRKGEYTDVEVRRIGLTLNTLMEAPIYIDDSSDLTITQIRERARRLHQEHPLDFVIVDHIQLVQPAGHLRNQNMTAQVTETTRQLKQMARELKVPVMALSQLNRSVEGRQSKVPELRDLRESGSSEQDADVVMLMFRDDYYDPDSERQGLADISIAKQRNGPTGKLTLIFNRRVMKFLDIEVYR
jgi:replicative DNA helicase